MDATLFRSAFNPIIAEARDACHGLYHASDRRHAGAGRQRPADLRRCHAFAVKAVIDKVARDRRRSSPATPFSSTTPMQGGTHLNDFRLVRPIFRDGQLFCWLASVGHWLDIGGNVARRLQSQGDREPSGGRALPAGQAVYGRRLNQDIRRYPRRQFAPADVELGRSQRPAQRARPRRARLGALIDDYGASLRWRPPSTPSPSARKP